MLNLMRIAAVHDSESLFDRYGRTLARVRLPARQRAYYHVFAAEGWLRFDRPALARRHLERAEYLYDRYGIIEIDEKLSQCLRALESKQSLTEAALPAQDDKATALIGPDLRHLIDQAPAAAIAWQSGRKPTTNRAAS
jgi:hypothetical protein